MADSTSITTPNTATPNTADANNEYRDRIAKILRQREASEAAELAEADAIADAEAAIIRERKRIADTQDKITASRLERDRLARELAKVESQILPDRVTLEVARQAARDLLRAFGEYRGTVYNDPTEFVDDRPNELPELKDRIRNFWVAAGKIKSRLLTTEIDEDAIDTLMAVDGLLMAVDRFREDQMNPADAEDNPHSSGLDEAPPASRRVEAIEKELKSFMAGAAPTEMQSMGDLVYQGVQLEQLARTLGLVRPNGRTCLLTFAMLIDSRDPQESTFAFIRWMGCFTFAEAFARRQSQVESRRAKNWPHESIMSHISRD